MLNPLKLFLVDATAPFFTVCPAGSNINWSKIPFHLLEKEGRLDPSVSEVIVRDFKKYLQWAQQIGYNAITIDDMAHLVDHDCYPSALRQKILDYQQLYELLFAEARSCAMGIYVNSDFMYFNKSIERFTGKHFDRITHFFTDSCDRLFTRFPAICGI